MTNKNINASLASNFFSVLLLAGFLIFITSIAVVDAYNGSSFTKTDISSATVLPGSTRTVGLNILFPDPTDTAVTDGSAASATGDTLVAFNSTTTFLDASSTSNGVYNDGEAIVRDVDEDGFVSSGDTVITAGTATIRPLVDSEKVCWRDHDGLDFDYTSATAFDAIWWDSAGDCSSFTSGTDIVLSSTSTDFGGASSTLFGATNSEQEIGYIDVDGNNAYTVSRTASTTEPIIYTGTNAVNWLVGSTASTTAVFFDSSTVATDGLNTLVSAAGWDQTGTTADPMDAFGATYKYEDDNSGTNYTDGEDIYTDDDSSGLISRDQLNAITIQNAGNGIDTTDISKIEVWQDDGDASFSATSDTSLGEAAYDSSNSWDLSSLTTNYDAGSPIRVFVTFDIASGARGGRTVQLEIPTLSDGNSSGGYNSGDEGIFLVGTNDSPEDAAITNSGTLTVSGGASSSSKCKADLAPGNVTNATVSSTGNSGELTLSWTNPSDSDFDYVAIYRSTIDGFPGYIQYYESGTSKLDVGLTDGKAYYYTLKAVDTCNVESVNNPVVSDMPQETPTLPPAPPVDESAKDEDVPVEPEIPQVTSKGPSGLVPEGNKASALSIPSISISINEGDLVRGEDGVKVYVVKNGYLRWVQSPAIMDMYGHFQWLNIKEISNADLTKFFESSLIRAEGDDKVYEIDSQGKKHWLNMTAEDFGEKGLSWDAIYIINKEELEWYGTGGEINN